LHRSSVLEATFRLLGAGGMPDPDYIARAIT